IINPKTDVIPEADGGRDGGKDPGSHWADYGKECDEGQFTIGFMFEALKGGFQVNTNMVGNKRYATGFLNNRNGSLSVYIFKEYEDGSQKTLIERLVDYSPSAIVPVVIKYDLGHFQVFFKQMDEELSQPFIDYTDSNPLPSGKIDFESLKDSSVNLSNVVTICSSSLEPPVTMGAIHFEEGDPSYLINGTSDDPFARWGEVPANQIMVTIDINMNFQEARALARQLASGLGKATNQEANVVGEMEFINLFQIETQGRTLEDLIRDIDFAKSYSSQIFGAFPNQQIYPEHSPRDLESSVYSNEARGKGYQMIGVQDAWRRINSYNKQFSKVVVGVVDDGIYLGDGQFDNQQIDTSIKIYQNPPCCELSSHLSEFPIPGSHGTGIASILAADADNGLQGIASCLPKDKLKIFMINISRNGGGFVTSSMLAFQYEIQNGSSIISCSMGKTFEVDPGAAKMYDSFFTKLANNTTFDSVLFIFSAGNEGISPKGEERIPNGLPINKSLSNVITVGNILNDGNISAGQPIEAGTDLAPASKSNKAGRSYEVTLAAPGEQSVWGVYNNKIQNYWGGTSMATPHVTAAAALIRSIDPCLTAGEIKAIIIKTAHNQTGNTPASQELGGRILAIDKALNETIRQRSPKYCMPFLNGESIFLPGDYNTYDEIYGSKESSVQPVLPVTVKPSVQPSSGLSTTITIISTQYKGYTIQVDGQTIGTEGQGQDALDGRYTFTVAGNQQHQIKVDHPMNWKRWQYFYNAGETIVYDF
ncbi:MAG: S8 family serine peptidase, partial [Syntrophomonas sp.]|nr:S8 family serine peptidase [Syntrophomonas sp.]